jgi:hypothetical protein
LILADDREYHGGVVEVFTSLLTQNKLSLSNDKQNQFGNSGEKYDKPKDSGHEGVVSANKVNGSWQATNFPDVPGTTSATWV